MATQSELMGAGMPWLQASMIGSSLATALTAAGTNKAGALALTATANIFTTVASSSGAALPPAGGAAPTLIYNGGANPLSVYTGNSTDVINALSAGGAFSVTNGKSAIFWPCGNAWVANLSA